MGSSSGSDLLFSLALSGIDSSDDGGDAGQSILGLLDLGDGDVGRVDRDLVGGAVGLVLGELVDVDHPLLSEDLDDLSFAALACSAHHYDFIVLADGEGSDAPLLAEVLGEG